MFALHASPRVPEDEGLKHALTTAAAVLAALAASTSLAQTASPGGRVIEAAASTPASARPVMICADDDFTRQAYAEAYGRARYLTAEDVSLAAARGDTWNAPRCITETELRRYQTAFQNKRLALAQSR